MGAFVSFVPITLISDIIFEASWVMAGKATTEKMRGTRTIRLVKKRTAKRESTVTFWGVVEGLREVSVDGLLYNHPYVMH